MTLRAKWIFCALLFICLLGTGAWLDRMLLEDRPHRAMKIINSPNGGYRSYSVTDTEEQDISHLNYKPREYVKITRRER